MLRSSFKAQNLAETPGVILAPSGTQIMTTKELKELAKLIVGNERISTKVGEYLLGNLGRKELKEILFYLKNEARRRRVVIRTAESTDEELKNKLTKTFEGRIVEFAEDDSLGGGIIIEDGDDTIDFSVKNLIKKTIDELKSN